MGRERERERVRESLGKGWKPNTLDVRSLRNAFTLGVWSLVASAMLAHFPSTGCSGRSTQPTRSAEAVPVGSAEWECAAERLQFVHVGDSCCICTVKLVCCDCALRI